MNGPQIVSTVIVASIIADQMLPTDTLRFANQTVQAQVSQHSPSPAEQPREESKDPIELFAGGLDSLAMRVAGNTEGNLNPDGSKNPNYYGHVDPGDGHWNIGACSESNARNGTNLRSPAEADQYCLDKLKNSVAKIESFAADAGVDLTIAEKLTAIDLYNQAPATLVESPNYFDRLIAARQRNTKGLPALTDAAGQLPALNPEDAAIAEARTEAFSVDPESTPIESRRYQTTFKSRYWLHRDQRRRVSAKRIVIDKFLGDGAERVVNISYSNPSDQELRKLLSLLRAAETEAKNLNP